MDNKKLNKISASNLVIAYLLSTVFILLIIFNKLPQKLETEIVFNHLESNKTEAERIVKYIDRNNTIITGSYTTAYSDKLGSAIIDRHNNLPVINTKSNINVLNHEQKDF